MILYPAIDLKDGKCVRLLRGEMSAATVFNADPADQARQWEAAGFAWLHLVDLNGAIEGKPVNGAAVEAILRAIKIPAQLGGGIRDMARIEDWLAKGIRRVPGKLDAYLDYYSRLTESLDGLSAEMIYWERPQGGRVFHAGAVGAAWVIGSDPLFGKLLANVLHRFGVAPTNLTRARTSKTAP